MAIIAALTAAMALFQGSSGDQKLGPVKAQVSLSPVSYRPDGGQTVSPAAGLRPNSLTRLNNGQLIELSSANPGHLAHLPSLGPSSAVKAVKSGCLNSRQKKTLNGIITETCDQNKP